MAVRIIKNWWWVDFRSAHVRYRKRSPQNSRASALLFESVLRQRLARGESLDDAARDERREQTFEEFAAKWFAEYVVPNNKPSEQRRKRYALAASLIPFFGKMPIAVIGTNDVERYKAQALKTGVTAKTVNNLLGIFRTCVWTAYEWLELEGRPPKVRRLKCPSPETDYLAPEECEALLARADGVVYELILTALKTGMRQGELKGLQWSSIDWENGSVAVRHSRSDYTKALGTPKNGRARHIPMDADIHRTLLKRRKSAGYVFLDADGMPFDHKRLTRRLQGVCKKAGLRRIGWHALRHTFASQLVAKGAPLPAVQMLMGHSTIGMTMRYTHLAPATLREAIDRLSGGRAQNLDLGQPVGNRWPPPQMQAFANDNRSSERAYNCSSK